MPSQDKYAHWRALLARNSITKVLQELREVLAKSDRLDEILQQSGRYASLRKSIRLGIISHEDKTVTENKIRSGLFDLLKDMESWEQTDPAVASELALVTVTGSVDQAILGSDVAVGGNMQIGNNTTINQFAQLADPHFLTPKPQKPEIFVGREDQLQALHTQLFAPNVEHFLLLINGEGGIGKTTLAAAYFRRYHGKYAHAAWVLGEISIAGALLTLAVGLNLEFGPKEDTNQRLHRLMTRLANLKKPCLLVVDNANNLEDLDANYEILRRCDNFHILLTSRLSTYSRAQLVSVAPLDTDTAQDLFTTHYRSLSEEETLLFPTIYKAVGGNTLVLEILAKNLKRVNTLRERYTLADLLRDLQEKGLLQLVESRTVETQYGKLHRAQPAEIIGAMYELDELTDPQLKLLSVFAALPSDKIPVAHLEVLLDDFSKLEEPLLDLTQRGWVAFDVEERSFRCSQVVQEVTRENQINFSELISPIGKSLKELLETIDYQYPVRKMSEVRPFFPYAHSYLNALSNLTSKLFLFQQLGDFYRAGGDLRSSLEQYQGLRQSAEILLSESAGNTDYKHWLAISYERLGSTHRSLGNLNKALMLFEKRLRLSQELYTAFPANVGFKNGLAVSYSRLGSTHSSLGNLKRALEFFELDIALSKELHAAYPANVGYKNGLSISYEKLGGTHSLMGNLAQSLKFFEERSRLSQELHDAYPANVGYKNGLAISYSKLGKTHSALGNLTKALEYFEERLKLGKELHTAYPANVVFKNGLAVSYEKLGNTHQSLKNTREATSAYQKSTKLLVGLAEQFPDNLEFRSNLAEAYRNEGSIINDLAKKIALYQKAESIWIELVKKSIGNVSFQKLLDDIRERLAKL